MGLPSERVDQTLDKVVRCKILVEMSMILVIAHFYIIFKLKLRNSCYSAIVKNILLLTKISFAYFESQLNLKKVTFN